MDLSPALSETPRGIRIRVQAQPGARHAGLVGLHGQALKIKIKSPPEDGRANDELLRYLAEVLKTSRSSLSLDSGQTSRSKVICAKGLTVAQILDRLEHELRESQK